MTSRNHTQVRTLRDDVSDLMAKEECLWQQRGHVEWLKLGGRLVMLFVFFLEIRVGEKVCENMCNVV